MNKAAARAVQRIPRSRGVDSALITSHEGEVVGIPRSRGVDSWWQSGLSLWAVLVFPAHAGLILFGMPCCATCVLVFPAHAGLIPAVMAALLASCPVFPAHAGLILRFTRMSMN